MKTISELSNKAWYRAVKVIYLLSFLAIIALIITVFSVEGDFDVLDIQNSKIICQFGNEKTFLVKDIFGKGEISTLNDYDLQFTSANEEKIKKYCEIDKEKLLAEGVWRVGENGRIEAEVFDSGIWGGVVEYRVEEEHTKNYGYLFLSLLITAAVFEGVRRAFYYITLGTINPQK